KVVDWCDGFIKDLRAAKFDKESAARLQTGMVNSALALPPDYESARMLVSVARAVQLDLGDQGVSAPPPFGSGRELVSYLNLEPYVARPERLEVILKAILALVEKQIRGDKEEKDVKEELDKAREGLEQLRGYVKDLNVFVDPRKLDAVVKNRFLEEL